MSELDELFKSFNLETEVEREYASSESLDDLLYFVADRLLLAAVRTMYTLNIPEYGNLALKIIKFLSPQRYNNFWNTTNRLLTECMFFVVYEFWKDMQNDYKIKLRKDVIEKILFQAGVNFYMTIKMNKKEIAMFENIHGNMIYDFESCCAKTPNELLDRMVAILQTKPSPTELKKFIEVAIARRYSEIVEPWSFTKHYRRLLNQETNDKLNYR